MSTGYIPQEILDEIVARCDIVSVINEYMPLKRRGNNYQGLCPFHNEKTPSFSVSPAKQIFHCFGCGKGGNVFRFIMDIENISFLEAVEKLAKRANVRLPEKEMTVEQRKKKEQRKRYLQINDFVARYYHKVLVDTSQGEIYRNYLKKRQISDGVIETFQLGATPDGWDNLYQALKKHGVTTQEMLDLGLVTESRKQGEYIDRFRKRLMFPIGDEKGNTIAFGGRILDKSSSPQKYLNSPDTPLFHKSQNLYGIHLARTDMRNADFAIIVEGYMDVISCHQYGITNAVAPLGTAFTTEQGRLLMRNTYQIGISFDGDIAGTKATMRCLDILSDLGCTAKVIQIPDQKDPDEYLRIHGKDAFLQLVDEAQELIMYKIARYMETTNTDSIAGKMKVIRMLIPDFRKMRSAVERETAVRQISVRLQVSEKAIWEELRNNDNTIVDRHKVETRDVESQKITMPEIDIENKVEKSVLQILFDKPELLSLVESYGGSMLLHGAAAQLYQEFALSISKSGKVDSAGITQENGQLLAKVLMDVPHIVDSKKMLECALRQLKQEQLDLEYQKLSQKLMENKQVEDINKMQELQETLQRLDAIRKEKKEFETSWKGE